MPVGLTFFNSRNGCTFTCPEGNEKKSSIFIVSLCVQNDECDVCVGCVCASFRLFHQLAAVTHTQNRGKAKRKVDAFSFPVPAYSYGKRTIRLHEPKR